MRMLRRIKGVTLRDRVKSVDIRKELVVNVRKGHTFSLLDKSMAQMTSMPYYFRILMEAT